MLKLLLSHLKKQVTVKVSYNVYYLTECTSSSFDKAKLMEFLRHNGVFGLGFWRRECLSICQKDAPPFGTYQIS